VIGRAEECGRLFDKGVVMPARAIIRPLNVVSIAVAAASMRPPPAAAPPADDGFRTRIA
jgi:hypothetical protein